MVDEEGETVIVLLVAPVLQEYEVAPRALMVVVSPAHKVAEFTVIVGDGLTKTVVVFMEVQPKEFPMTE
jgi:hypothetical protein